MPPAICAPRFATPPSWARRLPDEERALLFERLSYECYLTDEMADASVARETGACRVALARLAPQVRAMHCAGFPGCRGSTAARPRPEAYASEAVTVLEQLPAGRELAMAYSNSAQLYMLAENVDRVARMGPQGARTRHPPRRDGDRGARPHQYRHGQAGGRRSDGTRRPRTGARDRLESAASRSMLRAPSPTSAPCRSGIANSPRRSST